MDGELARQELERHLDRYRALSYDDLRSLVGSVITEEVVAGSGWLQLEIQFFWDGLPNQNIRVIASVDDGGRSALAPLSDDFVKAPNGAFVGE